jgi:hypothetical protein
VTHLFNSFRLQSKHAKEKLYFLGNYGLGLTSGFCFQFIFILAIGANPPDATEHVHLFQARTERHAPFLFRLLTFNSIKLVAATTRLDRLNSSLMLSIVLRFVVPPSTKQLPVEMVCPLPVFEMKEQNSIRPLRHLTSLFSAGLTPFCFTFNQSDSNEFTFFFSLVIKIKKRK